MSISHSLSLSLSLFFFVGVQWFEEKRTVKAQDFLGYVNSWSSVSAWEEGKKEREEERERKREGEGEREGEREGEGEGGDPREELKKVLEGVEEVEICFPFFLSTFVLKK